MGRKSRKQAERVPLDRERVLWAALDLADARGLETLSMRNLGQSLGVEAMSLYNHVAHKEDLLDGMVELVVAEIALPRLDVEWRVAMRERAQSAHAALIRHPWATMLFVSRLNIGPNMLRYVDASMGVLLRAGFPYALADHAWSAIDAYLYGFAIQKRNFPLEPAEYATAAQHFLPMIPPNRFPHLHGMSLEVIAGRHDGVHELEFGLEVLLDGLERLRAAER